jgi:hypothetical protein
MERISEKNAVPMWDGVFAHGAETERSRVSEVLLDSLFLALQMSSMCHDCFPEVASMDRATIMMVRT